MTSHPGRAVRSVPPYAIAKYTGSACQASAETDKDELERACDILTLLTLMHLHVHDNVHAVGYSGKFELHVQGSAQSYNLLANASYRFEIYSLWEEEQILHAF